MTASFLIAAKEYQPSRAGGKPSPGELVDRCSQALKAGLGLCWTSSISLVGTYKSDRFNGSRHGRGKSSDPCCRSHVAL